MGPEWLNQILDWIRDHPSLAGLTIAVVAFLEGLALVGILIPGIIILFGFGALVGLGILELSTVWIWCSVGAILGDGVSFWLGYHFKFQLREIWPFSRFDELFKQGEAFFRKHGLKSIVIGRFIGPIRPVMPVVAGMLGMSVKRYVPANIVAGTLWAPAYLLPGVLFGASIELAKVVAFRLALVLCLLAGAIWLLIFIIGEAYLYLAPRGSRMLAFALRWSHKHPLLGRFTRPLVDPRRRESGTLALFAIMLVLTAWALLSLLIALPLFEWPAALDATVRDAMLQLRSPWADGLMAFFNGMGTVFVVLPASAGVLFWLLIRRRPLAAWHWAGAVGVGVILAATVSLFVRMSRGDADFLTLTDTLPLMHITASVVVYGFFAVLIARELPVRRRVWPYMVGAIAVACVGLSRLYFGAHAPTDLIAGILLGLLWIAIIGIAYRRRMRRSFWTFPVAGVFYLLVGVCAVWYGMSYARLFIQSHTLPVVAVSLPADTWWRQGWRPDARGQLRQLEHQDLNVQIAGDLDGLRLTLLAAGWSEPPPARWATAIEMLQPRPTPDTLPLLPSAWRGREEALLMHRKLTESDRQLVLRIWPTEVRIDGNSPLWAGTVAEHELSRVLFFFSYWDHGPNRSADLQRLAGALEPLPQRLLKDGLLLVRTPPAQ